MFRTEIKVLHWNHSFYDKHTWNTCFCILLLRQTLLLQGFPFSIGFVAVLCFMQVFLG